MNFIIQTGKGKRSLLDKQYGYHLSSLTPEQLEELEVLNVVVKELLESGEWKKFDEFKYRVTDGESPNKVMLDILHRCEPCDLSNLTWQIKRQLEENF